ncbi:MAG: hypothetical protein VB948_10395, partial [Pseudomonadales bacterium]
SSRNERRKTNPKSLDGEGQQWAHSEPRVVQCGSPLLRPADMALCSARGGFRPIADESNSVANLARLHLQPSSNDLGIG